MFLLLYLIALTCAPATQPVADTTMKCQRLDVERLPDLNLPRFGHNVFYAGDELTVVGGHTSGFVLTPTAEYYEDGAWHLLTTVYSHDDGMAVVLDGGKRVLLAGGHEKNLGIGQTYEVEIYYPGSHSFEGFGCLDRNRAFSQGVEMPNGEVVITGNHQGNDAIEIFDGRRALRFVKDVDVWRTAPYVLPIGEEEVMVFGAVWREGRFLPCDTVLRLQGASFRVPLLKDWMPIINDQNSHFLSSFIGDKETGDYSYLIAAQNGSGEIGFLLIQDTVFTLLPTTCSVPTEWGGGCIRYDRVAVADRTARRVYLVGTDSTARVYVVAVDYSKSPSPITFYHSEPLPDFGNVSPVLTPDGNLVAVGGYIDNNFALLSSVWLLKMNGKQDALTAGPTHAESVWWFLGLLLLVVLLAGIVFFVVRRHKKVVPTERANAAPDVKKAESSEAELMARIVGLMENEKLYLNPELKVGDVADALGENRNAVSACINSHQGCTFSQFVNDYRIQHVQRLLLDTAELKISAIGLESGFANERSFFRAFKTATSMTPKEWKVLQNRNE